MFTPPSSPELKVSKTTIEGLIIFDLDIRGDNRGWFKENWQRKKMTELGLPDFGPIQNNFSFNGKRGTMRGIHAEAWDKFISVGYGSFFGAWVDLRKDSPTFGTVFTAEINPGKAIFVPSGVGNSYLTLEDNTVYSYLVNDYWYPDAKYTFVSALDPNLKIDWPIPPEKWEMSEKDKNHPNLKDISPMEVKKTLVIGANGQVGRALRKVMPNAEFVSRTEFDVTDPEAYTQRNWRQYGTLINATGYTAVDAAEEDIAACWNVNATAVARMAQVAAENKLTFVHLSTDYVFDGKSAPYAEDAPLSPRGGVYANSKAAGDIAASTAPLHYIVRVSWVVGEGKNFVRIMMGLAEKGVKPAVVSDQTGRLTFADDIAAGIKHLLDTRPAYGTYNLSNEGEVCSWADIAREVYARAGHDRSEVSDTTTEAFFAGKIHAPRPAESAFNLDKIEATGFTPRDWKVALKQYMEEKQ